ncbi:FMN-linked oxidoreductase [Mycena sp. CBHHK59/15]|nr:FMN-linked oxidoreductase [Mycena sp. CBHHK59/15]
MSSTPVLFQPIRVGEVELQHRVVFAPSTRFRANEAHVPLPIVAQYYAQRGSAEGTLLIAEAAFIAEKAGGFRNVPGIWTPEQIASWKTVTDAVHAQGSFIYLQLWALGRSAYVSHLAPGDPYVSSSPKKLETVFHQYADPRPDDIPREMTVEEIKEYSKLFATAASNAVHKTGFDGVEMHGANGYLLEQFMMDSINERTDSYGGSVENCARFTLEVRTAIRLSPWNTKQGSGMHVPKPTYGHVVREILTRHPDLSYIHVVEPPEAVDPLHVSSERPSNDFIREIWGERPLISAGGYTRQNAIRAAAEKGDLIAFSRAFIANPDLPCRLVHDIPLVKGDGSKYYVYGSDDPSGYTDYKFHFTHLANKAVAVSA